MTFLSRTLPVVLGIVVVAGADARMQAPAAPARAPMQLTALDYIEIQQLVAKYAQYIDTCSNNGYDYADLFAADGYFAPFINGRVGGKWQGRERLAEASGGGKLGCKNVHWIEEGVHHMYVNHIITPTPDGATGTVNMLMIGLDGDKNKIEHDGYYDDAYVKTPQGWRFQSRIHHALRPARATSGGAAAASAVQAQTSSTACQNLAKTPLAGATISSAESVAAGRFVPPSAPGTAANEPFADLGPFCRVVTRVKGAGTSIATIEVWLPLNGWNQEFEPAGSSFWGGSIPYARMREILRTGAATAGSNLGITGATGPSFVVDHPDWMTNLGNAPFHSVVEQGKALAAAFYGKAVTATLMNECGGGGSRDVLAETQRWPADLDAAAAIGFTNYGTHHGVAQMWLYWATHKDAASFIPPEKYRLIHNAVLDACDAKDGVKDGIVEDPPHCAFDPGVLACRGADAPTCLTSAQVAAVRTAYETPKHARTHEPLYGPMVPGSEFSWAPMTLQSHPYPYSEAFYRYVIFRDPKWDYKNWKPDFAADVDRADARGNLVINATNPDIRAFVDRGGKLLLMGGWNDDLGPGNNITYYESVRRAIGDAKARDAVRLFMVPGMNHCLELPYDSTYTVHFDPLQELRAWKQSGRAPEEIVVRTQAKNEAAHPRKVCAYPKVSQYRGSGSVDDPKNFVCREP